MMAKQGDAETSWESKEGSAAFGRLRNLRGLQDAVRIRKKRIHDKLVYGNRSFLAGAFS